MLKRRWLSYATMCCVLISGSAFALTKEEVADKKRKKAEEVYAYATNLAQNQIGKALQNYDYNQQQKHIINLHFSPFQAMSASSELLLWIENKGADYKQREELIIVLQEQLRAHVQLSAAGVPLKNWEGEGQPISLPLEVTLPRYNVVPNPDDLSTYTWRNEYGEGRISAGSIGQSFRGISLFLQSSAADNDPDLREILLISLLEGLDIVTTKLFLGDQLGEIKSGTYVPQTVIYDDKEDSYTLDAGQSLLTSQLSLIQGLVRLQQFLQSEKARVLLADKAVAGKDLEVWQKLAHQALVTTYQTFLVHHFDVDSGSFISIFQKDKKVKRTIRLVDGAMVADVLSLLHQLLPKDDEISKSARQHLLSQVEYFHEKLIGSEGDLPKSFHLASGYAVPAMIPNFQMQISTMLMMLEAYGLTEEPQYLEMAEKIFTVMKPDFWSEGTQLYRSAMGYTVSGYDAFLFGKTLRWVDQMKRYLSKLDDFEVQGEIYVAKVLKEGGLLQCETIESGEVIQLTDVFDNRIADTSKKIAKLPREERAAAASKYVRNIVDQDGDSVPGCRFSGGQVGAAPVMLIQTSVRTPFPVRTMVDKDGNVIELRPPGGIL
jgi:hypothetical protein